MIFNLSAIKKNKRRVPLRILVYGSDGVGKSTFATKAPKPLFFDLEDGLVNIKTDRWEMRKASFDEVMEGLRFLYKEEHGYKTVVIDSVDWLETKIHQKVAEESGKQSIEDIGYAKGYTVALDYWNQLLSAFDALRDLKKMNIILLGHGQITRIEDPTIDSHDRWDLKLHKKAKARVKEWVDIVGFACPEIFTTKKAQRFGSDNTKAVNSGNRLLHTRETTGFEAKSRFTLQSPIPLSYSVLDQELNPAPAPSPFTVSSAFTKNER